MKPLVADSASPSAAAGLIAVTSLQSKISAAALARTKVVNVVCLVVVFGLLWPSIDAVASATASTVDDIPITANETAAALIRRGLDAADEGEDAGHYFAAAHASDPSSVTAQFLAGTALPALDQRNAAMDAALATAGKLPEAERLTLQFVAARFRFDVLEQTRISDLLVQRVPGSAIAHGFRGEALWLSGDTAGAEREYRRVLAIDPSKIAALAALGYAALTRNDVAEAQLFFRKFAALRPHSPRPHDALGEALLRGGRLDSAFAEFVNAATTDPTFAMAYQGEAVVKLYQDDAINARAAMRAFVEHSNDKGGADVGLAQLELALGDASAADRALDDAITRRPGDRYWSVLITVIRGSLREYNNHHTEAIALLEPLRNVIAGLRVPESQKRGLDILRLQWLAHAQGALRFTPLARASADAEAALAEASPKDKVRSDQAASAAWSAAMSAGDAKAALQAIVRCQSCRSQRIDALELAGRRTEAARERAYLASHYFRDSESALVWALRK